MLKFVYNSIHGIVKRGVRWIIIILICTDPKQGYLWVIYWCWLTPWLPATVVQHSHPILDKASISADNFSFGHSADTEYTMQYIIAKHSIYYTYKYHNILNCLSVCLPYVPGGTSAMAQPPPPPPVNFPVRPNWPTVWHTWSRLECPTPRAFRRWWFTSNNSYKRRMLILT